MDIEIIEMAERKAKFILRNSSPAMANALRRTLLSDIPKMAIDKVEFHLGPIMYDDKEYESVTPLFDEIIAHRLGMVPVPTDLNLFCPQSECVCGGEGCPNCTIMYSLNKIGPCTVLSGDLEPLGNPDLRVKDEFIPIVELTDGQAVLIYATAVMGTAKKHVKWQVANGVGYKYLPQIAIDEGMESDEEVLECAAICPKKVFEVEDGKLVIKNPLDCSLCRACTDHLGERGGITVKGDDKNFFFKFETDGSLTAQQALDKAVEILADEAKDFKAQLEQL
ncbi:MAG: DNA-directed RNA polymerase subunit D [Candidatus Methanomethylophilaceae archaeon]|nr:DNA-directed RNA polymerase subunit D [Candidatus Methanomethylophilaceae archaeon]